MLKYCAVLLTTFFVAISCSPAAPVAQDEPWKIVARSGVVQIDQAGKVRDAVLDETLAVGAAVTTGFESSATISNGQQLMKMAANSRVAIPEEKQRGMTRVLQNMGSILFQVDHRQAPHFRVETPLLAAIVKGTTFEVAVNGEASSITVTDGLVNVRANEGAAQQDLPSGGALRVAASAPQALVQVTPQEFAAFSALSASNVSLLRGKVGAGDGMPSPASVSMPVVSASAGTAAAADVRGALAAVQGGISTSTEVQAAPSSSSSRPAAPKKQEAPNTASPFNSTAFTVTLYVVGTLVGWALFVVGFAYGRSVLREMKAKKDKDDKAKSKPPKK